VDRTLIRDQIADELRMLEQAAAAARLRGPETNMARSEIQGSLRKQLVQGLLSRRIWAEALHTAVELNHSGASPCTLRRSEFQPQECGIGDVRVGWPNCMSELAICM